MALYKLTILHYTTLKRTKQNQIVNMLPAIRLMRLWHRALIPELRDHLDVQPTTKGSWIHLSREGRQASDQPSDASTPYWWQWWCCQPPGWRGCGSGPRLWSSEITSTSGQPGRSGLRRQCTADCVETGRWPGKRGFSDRWCGVAAGRGVERGRAWSVEDRRYAVPGTVPSQWVHRYSERRQHLASETSWCRPG